jgi:protein kinase A
MDTSNNAKQPTASSSSSSSATASTTKKTGETVKKFKLDPMSLLLPHERQMYANQNSANAAPTSQPQFGQPQAMSMHMYQQQQAGRIAGAGSVQQAQYAQQSQRSVQPGK